MNGNNHDAITVQSLIDGYSIAETHYCGFAFLKKKLLYIYGLVINIKKTKTG